MQRRLVWLVTYAIVMAYLESAVVADLRALYYPNGFTFPLVPLPRNMAAIEVGREAATLVMLLAVAALCGEDRWERFLSFCIAFGVWDLFYYAWLWVFIQWPTSLLTWDILFLIPVPWISPVLAPVLVSVALVAAAGWLWHLKARGNRLRFSAIDWTLALAGGCLVLVAFMVNFEEATTQAEPSAFHWGLYSAGLLLSLSGLVRGVSNLRETNSRLNV